MDFLKEIQWDFMVFIGVARNLAHGDFMGCRIDLWRLNHHK